MILLRSLGLATLLLFGACAGSNPPLATTRYLLPQDALVARARSAAVDVATGPVLVLGPVQVADYLDTEGLVLQLDDITLNAALAARWAEPLARQLQRGLRQRLQNRLPELTVLDGSAPSRGGAQLRVEVVRFHGTHTGTAVAAGQWQWRDAAGALLDQQAFEVEVALDVDGYPALVRALGRAWDQVADGIVSSASDLF